MFSFSKNPVLILATLIVTFGGCSEAQNCAIPRIVTLSQDDSLPECNGTVFATISTMHIESIINLTHNYEDFITVNLSKSSNKLNLEVKTSCSNSYEENTSYKTYIDKSWAKSIEIQVELNCTDGRNKIVTFVVLVMDQNTQRPTFQNSTYNLNVPICDKGTHNGTCPLNFESQITVFDDDRDEINANMEFYTELNGTLTDLILIPPPTLDQLRYTLKSSGEQVTRRQMNVHLYLKESDQFKLGDSIYIDLIAYNNQTSPNGKKLYAKTTVCLTFGDIVIDPSKVLWAPVFTSNSYYAIVTSLIGIEFGSELADIGPTKISASSLVTLSENGTVYYEMVSEREPCIFTIDRENGTVKYNLNVTEVANFVEVCEIRAGLESYGFLKSSVPLIVYFNINGNSSTQFPPIDCTTTTLPAFTDQPIENSTPTGSSSTTDLIPNTTDARSTTIILPTEGMSTSERPKTTTTEWTQGTSNPTSAAPSTTSTGGIPTSERPKTTTTEWTQVTSNPTSPAPGITTTEGTYTSATQASEWTSSSAILTSSTAEVTTVKTTTSQPIFDTTTTETIPSTTSKYDNSTCCGNCEVIVSNFTCPIDHHMNYMRFPDPNDCSVFHACVYDGLGGANDYRMTCQEGLVFCPSKHICIKESDCCADCKGCDCDNVDSCLPSDHPANVCRNGNEYEADPTFCDVYHHCTVSDSGEMTRDCLMPCSTGTVWCPAANICVYESVQNCTCEGKIRRPQQCTLCRTNKYVKYLPMFWSYLSRVFGSNISDVANYEFI